MRKVLTLLSIAAGLLIAPSRSDASSCVFGTLTDYIALGSAGCSVGGANFFGFDPIDLSLFQTIHPGATVIPASAVTVTPSVVAGGPQLSFGVSGSASNGGILGTFVSFSANGLQFTKANLSLTGATVTGDGAVTVAEDLCLNDTFGVNPSTCSGSPLNHRTLAVAELDGLSSGADSLLLSPISSFFDVFADITIDAGPTGTALLAGNVVTQFDGTTPVPEPASLVLVGGALVGLAARRKRQ